jgi:hypothetical protein
LGSRVPTDEELLDGKIEMAPFMKYTLRQQPPQGRIIQPAEDLPPADFHEHVPRVDPDYRWTVRPTMLVPQQSPRIVR